jgi:phage/plasmid-associated DNA primase
MGIPLHPDGQTRQVLYLFGKLLPLLGKEDPFQFKNTAKVISSCNSMPHCKDYSIGWRERQFVIPFLKHFRGETSEISNYGDILSLDEKEMQGLIYQSIESLKTIIKNKKFSYEGYQEIYEESLYSAKNFIEEQCERTNQANDILTFKEIYDKCLIYCTEKGIPTPCEQELGRMFTYEGWETDRIKSDKKTVCIKRNIKWKEE